MTWIRTVAYAPPPLHQEAASMREEVKDLMDLMGISSDATQNESSCNSCLRCPLHKHIRNKAWPTVAFCIREDPSAISRQNRVGWSSLILAIYHNAPTEVIAEMLSLMSADERRKLLSHPVPNGARLCLHFAARYSDHLEVFKLLVEPYPLALAVPSTDGNRPLDRAIYYRKDVSILEYLEEMTKKEMKQINNHELRKEIVACCDKRLLTSTRELDQVSDILFVLEFYDFTKEREMIGLFWNMLSFIGIP